MHNTRHNIISVAPRFASEIRSGAKTIELRRRAPSFFTGEWFWIYETRPVGKICSAARLAEIHVLPLAELWERFGAMSRVTHDEFQAYFTGRDTGVGLEIDKVAELEAPLAIDELRRISPGFHPPQFFARVNLGQPLWYRLSAEAKTLGLGEPERTPLFKAG